MSDLIDRQALCDDLREYKVHPFSVSSDESEVKGYNDGIDLAISVIADFPSVESEMKKGKWIIRYFDMETYEYKEKVYNYCEKIPEGDVYCSECEESALLNGHEESVFSNFCPHCGAEMMNRGE